jgi:tripartite-type tricarboxylate transporter receptor subunit TctC
VFHLPASIHPPMKTPTPERATAAARALFIAISLLTPALCLSQIYPVKPVRLVSPFPPGGGSDAVGRVLAQALSEQTGQQVVLDPRGGAAGMIGTDLVAKAPPDGYTLLLGNLSPQSILPATRTKLPYDPVRDFSPVSLVATADYVLAVHPSLPARTLAELIALARRSPGVITYASSGNLGAPHLAGELLSLLAGGKLVHIPYKGTGPAAIGIMTGESMIMFGSAPSVLPHGRTGRLRILATTGAKRTQPELPTIGEMLPDYVMTQWYGVLAPAGTAPRTIERLHAEIVRAGENPKVLQSYGHVGVQPVTNTPAEFQSFLAAEIRKWTDVITRANLVAN